jgi:hypothetical protein
VQESFDQLLFRCGHQREEWLKMPRLQLGLLEARAAEWDRLLPWLQDEEQVAVLRQLKQILEPKLRVRIERTSSAWVLRRALRDLADCLRRFNHRWLAYLQGLDLSALNAEREDYNRYYLLEKECAMRSPRLARQGFQKLGPVTWSMLAEQLGALPVPEVKER